MEKRVRKNTENGHSWPVIRSSEYIFVVESLDSNIVHLDKRFFTCYHWSIDGFPCDHAVRVMLIGKMKVYKFIDEFSSVSAF